MALTIALFALLGGLIIGIVFISSNIISVYEGFLIYPGVLKQFFYYLPQPLTKVVCGMFLIMFGIIILKNLLQRV